MWRYDDLIDAAAEGFYSEEARLRQEQAVYGLDSLEEVDLHPVVVAGFEAAGWGVLREQRYPSDRGGRGSKRKVASPDEALESDRLRCDLVLTPSPGMTLADPLRATRAAAMARREKEGTLFESHEEPAGAEGQGPASVVTAQEAFWVEIKVVGQYCYEAGIPGPNRTYASQLVRGSCADLAKLARDPLITHSALLLVLFTSDATVAQHDLVQLLHRCLDRELVADSPVTRRLPIAERIGNAECTLSLIRPRKSEPPFPQQP